MEQTFKQLTELLSLSMNTKERIENWEEINWRELLYLSHLHQVIPMLYEGLEKSKLIQNANKEFVNEIRKISITQSVAQLHRTLLFLDIYEQFQEDKIQAVVVKGVILRYLYPNENYRQSGDEDVYIKKEDFNIVNKILERNGFQCEKKYSSMGDLKQEMSYEHPSGLVIEIHTDLFDYSFELFRHMEDLFENAFEHSISVQIESTLVQTLSLDEHFLFLVIHSAKHFISLGLGIRQLCDIVMFCEKYGKEINWEIIWDKVASLGYAKYLRNLLAIGEQCLGLSHSSYSLTKDIQELLPTPDALLYDIMSAGLYGFREGDNGKSASITIQAAINSKNNQFSTMRLIRILFPNYGCMRLHYDYCKKNIFLLPVAWVHRMLHHLLDSSFRSKLLQNTKNSMEIGRKRIELLKEYGII